MAITIQSSPTAFSSAHDALYHVVTSSNVANSNFKYVFDLSIGGNLVATIKAFPDSGGYGIFDASPIVRNYFDSGFNPNASTVLQNASTGLFCNYTIAYGEEYAGVTYPNLTTISTYYGWNYSADPFGNTLGDYANKFVTSRDKTTLEVISGEKLFVTYMNSAGTGVTASIQKITSNGTNDGSASVGATLSTSNTLLLDLSPTAINTYLGSSFITSTTYAYQVTVGSDTITITQVVAPKWTPMLITFLNQYGGYETFGFRLLSRQQKKFNRSNYKVNEFVRSGGNMINKSGANVVYGGVQSFAGMVDYSYLVVSDYLNVKDYNVGSQLLASPEAYLHLNGLYLPITMRSTDWQEKNTTSDKNFNYELTFDLANKQAIQYR
jgi:hypothetical protein